MGTWAGLMLQGLTLAGVLLILWRDCHQAPLSREPSLWGATTDQNVHHEAAPGTTFLPDDAETATREASLKKASRERADLIR